MQVPTLSEAILPILPVFTLIMGTSVLVIVDLFIPNDRKYWTAWLSVAGLLTSAVLLVIQANNLPVGDSITAYSGMLVVDGFALFLQGTFLLSAVLGILLALNYLPRRGIERGEYYTLLLFTTAGMMVMAMAADLIVVFLALELLSIPLYILSGLARPEAKSEESAMKYFLLGAFASGFLVYGIALIYGGTQTTQLTGIVTALAGDAGNPILAFAGMGLVLVGLGFKVAAVPFHMWTPDVYQGAPTPVTAFMSVGAKAGGFAALLRVLILAFPSIADEWGILVSIIAILTLVLGNVVAISQTNIKRLLAYSSIAHAGYVLVAVAAAQNPDVAAFASSAAIFYLLTYTVTNLGAFAVVIAVEKDDGTGTEIDDFAGLGKRRPGMAIAMTLFMLSLTGIPPSAGMIGKWFVFQAAVEASAGYPAMVVVFIVGVLTSVISAFYYIRVVIAMWMQEGEGEISLQFPLRLALILTAVGTFVLGIVPAPIYQMARDALMKLSG